MTKTEIIEALSNEAGLTTSKGKEVVKVFINEISNALTNNERVEIRGLCSFSLSSTRDTPAETRKQANQLR